MNKIRLGYTTYAEVVRCIGNIGYMMAINTASDDVACTINTRYEQPSLPNDILSLAHYPKTVILIEYF